MTGWFGTAVLILTLATGPLDLDCSRPGQARGVVGRLMLAEIESEEDGHRVLMWEAFGRCAAGSAGQPCRERERQQFEAQWDHRKQQIEAKYRRMLSEFEERCRSSIGRVGSRIRGAS
jgi:hypothetical protein